MTGRGHRWTGVGAAFFAAAFARWLGLPELIAGAVAAASCTVPDWAEIPYYRKGCRAGSLIAHRTLTHWPPLWLAAVAAGLVYLDPIPASIVLGICVGALTHILGDAPNPMGIPWLVPHRRLKLGRRGWWRSGEREPMIALTFGTFGFVAWRLAGG